MNEKTSITLAGDWSKPAQALIEKISDAIGGGLKPWQTKRVAKADAAALIIRTEGNIESKKLLIAAGLAETEAGVRAVQRMVANEVRKQVNIDNITRLTIERLHPDAKPESIDPDFVTDLFDKASNTSDEEMQQLWAGLLAGEANNPGTFSKRTITLISTLDKRDALMFSRFVSSCLLVINTLVPMTTPSSLRVLSEQGVRFDDLLHLDSLGLINFNPIGGFKQELTSGSEKARLVCHYFGEPVIVEFTGPPYEIACGAALLTDAGRQIASLPGPQPNQEILMAFIGDTISESISVQSIWPRPMAQRNTP